MVSHKAGEAYFVYLGPSVRGVIQHGQIFPGKKEAVEAFLARKIAKYPRIKTLLVRGDKLAEARIRIRQCGNYLSESYRLFADELKK